MYLNWRVKHIFSRSINNRSISGFCFRNRPWLRSARQENDWQGNKLSILPWWAADASPADVSAPSDHFQSHLRWVRRPKRTHNPLTLPVRQFKPGCRCVSSVRNVLGEQKLLRSNGSEGPHLLHGHHRHRGLHWNFSGCSYPTGDLVQGSSNVLSWGSRALADSGFIPRSDSVCSEMRT